MPPRRKPRTLRERMQFANSRQPLEAKRRGGLSRWAGLSEAERAAHVELLKAGAAARRAQLKASQDGPDAAQ